MLKILVVDDETPIRQWFVFCIEKSGKNYEVVGEASNGEEALEIFKRCMPDVVITDIKMPVMDGLELMRHIKNMEPATDIVILTCHADFEYARQAVKQGAAEYMLKTEVTDKEMLDILQRVEKKRIEQGIAKKAVQAHAQLQNDTFIKELMKNENTDGKSIGEKLRDMGIMLHDHNLFSLAVHPVINGTEYTPEEIMKLLLDEVVEQSYGFRLDKDFIVLLGNLKDVPSQLLQMNNLYTAAGYIHKSTVRSVGISNIYQGVGTTAKVLREAVKALEQEFFKGRTGIYVFTGALECRADHTKVKRFKEDFFHSLDNKDSDSMTKNITRMFDEFERSNGYEIEYIYQVCVQILEVLGTKPAFRNENDGLYNDISSMVKEKRYLSGLRTWMLERIENLNGELYRNNEKYSPAIRKAVEYIEANYNQTLSLGDVAVQVHLNAEYFSRLFKEDVGENFSIYLMLFRLKKAEGLLKNTSMKVYEVAEKVGYPNLSYFSRIYKKYMGKNALDIRTGRDG